MYYLLVYGIVIFKKIGVCLKLLIYFVTFILCTYWYVESTTLKIIRLPMWLFIHILQMNKKIYNLTIVKILSTTFIVYKAQKNVHTQSTMY